MTGKEYLKRTDLHPFWDDSRDPNREDVSDAYEQGLADGLKLRDWHDAESDDLPPYNKEVIVLCRRAEYFQEICFAHRPDPKGWYAKSLATGEIEHYKAVTYGEKAVR